MLNRQIFLLENKIDHNYIVITIIINQQNNNSNNKSKNECDENDLQM